MMKTMKKIAKKRKMLELKSQGRKNNQLEQVLQWVEEVAEVVASLNKKCHSHRKKPRLTSQNSSRKIIDLTVIKIS